MAEGETAAGDAAEPTWRGIDVLAGRVGAYCWVEQRLFEIAGAWASRAAGAGSDGDGEPGARGAELRVWCAASSRRHGALAARWAERLPVRVAVDQALLVRAPSAALADALDTVAGEDVPAGVAALVEGVLPGLETVYGDHLRTAAPVSEAPVMEVLVEARRQVRDEIGDGGALLVGLGRTGTRALLGAQLLEQAFADTDVFPAVPAS